MRLLSSTDFLSGLMLTVVGGLFACGAGAYDMGEASNMGPGYFPRLVAWLTIGTGGMLLIRAALGRSKTDGKLTGSWALRPLLFIISANLVFGVMVAGLSSVGLAPMGLVLGVYLLTGLAALAEPGAKLLPTLALASVLAALSWGLTRLLSLNVQIWPEFF
ncbi:MAG: tripartite tricarboxylate transporter TctB family protein [Betaproteobacteria bacterium]